MRLILIIALLIAPMAIQGAGLKEKAEETIQNHFGANSELRFEKYTIPKQVKKEVQDFSRQSFYKDFIYLWEISESDSTLNSNLKLEILETGDIWNIGKTLSKNGINVFMFDFRGCFNSEGKQGLMNSHEDIGAALTFLKSTEIVKKYNLDSTNIIVGGYSFGGHMSMLFAINHPEIKRVISVSGGDRGIFGDLVKSNANLRKGYSDFFQSIRKPNGPVEIQYEDPIQELIDNQEYFYILKQTDRLTNVDIFLTGGLDDEVVSLEDYVLPQYRNLKKIKYCKLVVNSINLDTLIKMFQTNS